MCWTALQCFFFLFFPPGNLSFPARTRGAYASYTTATSLQRLSRKDCQTLRAARLHLWQPFICSHHCRYYDVTDTVQLSTNKPLSISMKLRCVTCPAPFVPQTWYFKLLEKRRGAVIFFFAIRLFDFYLVNGKHAKQFHNSQCLCKSLYCPFTMTPGGSICSYSQFFDFEDKYIVCCIWIFSAKNW